MTHPEIENEQRYVDRAYERLEVMRGYAQRIVTQAGARYLAPPGPERDAFMRAGLHRSAELALGDEALIFGRIDASEGDTLYIGRTAVHDGSYEPLVTDWRAPAAEAFYRATPLDPMGLVRRRHLICRGPKVLRLDDELLDAEHTGEGLVLVGEGALLDAVRRSRTGRMRDIVATIQKEQDAVIRAPLEGVVVVQGGPGTGKTAVALHRAAYLLYAHRDRLQRSGVLIIGPNPIFLRYIEQVLPSLGETATLATLGELVPFTVVSAAEPREVAHLKGDARMAKVVKRAVELLPHELVEDARMVYEGHELVLTVAESRRLVRFGRESLRGKHNARRRRMARLIVEYLWEKWSKSQREWVEVLGSEGRRNFERTILVDPIFRAALDAIWPSVGANAFVERLLFTDEALGGAMSADERSLLLREEGGLTEADVALVDEAHVHLGPQRTPSKRARAEVDEEDGFLIERMLDDLEDFEPLIGSMRGILAERYAADRLALEEDPREQPRVPDRFGHVMVDEAQGLSPMQWRMIARRCPSRSMTILGDLGQASNAWVPETWQEALSEVSRHVEIAELTINYRTPGEIMDFASRVLPAGLEAPQSVRRTDEQPEVLRVAHRDLVDSLVEAARSERARLPDGKIAVIAPEELTEVLTSSFGLSATERHAAAMLDEQIAVLNVEDARGLEFDSVVIAEPAAIVSEYDGALRALYVALTRSTQRLVVIHTSDLPEGLAG